MYKRLSGLLLVSALGAVTSGAYAGDASPPGAVDESDARVVAYYQRQCQAWAPASGAADQAAYITQCLKDMPNIWPVGQDKSAGGGDG